MRNLLTEWCQTWMQKAKPRILLASQCFWEAYQAQKNVPGIAATIWDLVNSISKAGEERYKEKHHFAWYNEDILWIKRKIKGAEDQ
jgi:hypothetical protein